MALGKILTFVGFGVLVLMRFFDGSEFDDTKTQLEDF